MSLSHPSLRFQEGMQTQSQKVTIWSAESFRYGGNAILELLTCGFWLSAISGNQRLAWGGDRGQSVGWMHADSMLCTLMEVTETMEAGHSPWTITLLVREEPKPKPEQEVLGSLRSHFL